MGITRLPLRELLAESSETETSRRRTLADVNVRIAKARRVVVVSGAGISCASGIPDFRSENGLYSLVKQRYPDSFVTGKDLFSSGLFANPTTTSIFYSFIAELFLACRDASPTRTHSFIHRLEKKGKLLRSYTQNVDGFERRMGLESGGRGKGYKKNGTRNVELHGDLGRVRCVLCYADFEATIEVVYQFRDGHAPGCPACEERHVERMTRAARPTPIGTLRPSIVLYDEPHPLGDEISDLQVYDMRRRPEVLLVMGTSLKVHGLKRLVKDFAKVVHERKGIVVFVNATAPAKEWEGIIDYHIEGETDSWVERMEDEWKRVRPQDWETQETLDSKVVRGSIAKGKTKPKAKGRSKLPVDEPFQLPTPPASQPSDPCSSPLSSCPSESPPPSSPLSRPPPSLPASRSIPATPSSPSKRSPSRSLSQKAHKKSKTVPPSRPETGVAPTPGRGNLFSNINVANRVDSSTLPPGSPESDSEVFDSPPIKARVARSRAKTVGARTKSKSKPAPIRGGSGRLEVVIPAGDKENACPEGDNTENPLAPSILALRPTTLGAPRSFRRTVSVPA